MSDERIINYMERRLDRIEEKVDKLWAFRWFIAGAAASGGAVAGVVIQFMIQALTK